MNIRVQRLRQEDRQVARQLFLLMAEVFEEPGSPLSDSYLDRLLARDEFWAVAAFNDDRLAGGLTAHLLPMTRVEATELFIYDVAVHPERQRKGIGRSLINWLLEAAEAAGIETVFVPAESEDKHAIDFYRAVGGKASEVHLFTWSPPDE